MRLSLFVPDVLWLRALESYPASAPSRLVRAALESMMADAHPDCLQASGLVASLRDCVGDITLAEER